MATKATKPELDYITLKWGSLKAWHVHSDECVALLQKWADLGANCSAIAHRDTPEQKQILCELIDKCTAKKIYLDWDGKMVSKAEAKKYIMEYGTK